MAASRVVSWCFLPSGRSAEGERRWGRPRLKGGGAIWAFRRHLRRLSAGVVAAL